MKLLLIFSSTLLLLFACGEKVIETHPTTDWNYELTGVLSFGIYPDSLDWFLSYCPVNIEDENALRFQPYVEIHGDTLEMNNSVYWDFPLENVDIYSTFFDNTTSYKISKVFDLVKFTKIDGPELSPKVLYASVFEGLPSKYLSYHASFDAVQGYISIENSGNDSLSIDIEDYENAMVHSLRVKMTSSEQRFFNSYFQYIKTYRNKHVPAPMCAIRIFETLHYHDSIFEADYTFNDYAISYNMLGYCRHFIHNRRCDTLKSTPSKHFEFEGVSPPIEVTSFKPLD
jgi:hypothetical protein